MSILKILSREILDSRGNPTVETEVILANGARGKASVPSGASTGSREAIELRDGGTRFGGKGVRTAVAHVTDSIAPALHGQSIFDQRAIDTLLCTLDGSPNKARLGANAILSVSLACAKAAAASRFVPLHDYVAQLADTTDQQSLPMPMINIMNGGQHAANTTDIQEYMIIPQGASTFNQALEMGAAVFHSLAATLKNAGYATTVGDEGGYAPKLKHGNTEPLEHITAAVSVAGYELGSDITLALDVAASEFHNDNTYNLAAEDKRLDSMAMIAWLSDLAHHYPLASIEDGLSENDWSSWATLTAELGSRQQIVGDDLLVTNTELLERAINERAANAILIKPNQIGTLSETIDAVLMAKNAGWKTIMSHRSGETEDTTIAHLAVGLGTDQIKTGSLSRTDRIAKYNELLRIAEAAPHLHLAHPLKTTT